ncbi:tryptophan synthase subunit alpha [Candidatus Marinamargulisbacteria bacterium SCGC AAA071-K20]|nr:tryptophan synthase subunit alpha [Candidatus Marinamargulisbacteria bacterium SCGC AAA071-K20]
MTKLIEEAFKKKALIAYFTFGDPSISFSEELVLKAFENGADIIELGLPFSDPIADGPVIQASHFRALKKSDISIYHALASVKKIKSKVEKPLVFMTAVNLVFQYGIETFFKQSKLHGLDGVIIPDLSIESAAPYIKAAKQNDIALIFLVSPLCNETRLKKIVKHSTGFVYLISSTGITGERQKLSKHLESLTKKIKKVKNIPVAVGFGISSKAQVKEVQKFADGAIIGSHFVKSIDSRKQSLISTEIISNLKKLIQ